MRPSDLDPDRWQRIDTLLDAVLELPPGDREAFIAEACAEDEDLRAELDALISNSDLADSAFERSPDMLAAALAASSAALPADSEVGPFVIERELGRGGMGVVYLARDSRLGRRVALKFLPQHLAGGPDAKRRLEAEARAVSVLDHPNIATLYEIGETDDGQLYLVFAYYEGETLAKRIARGPLPMDEALSIATGIAAGLTAAHEKGIVHRDVKPSNVLLAPGGAKLLDFGVAKLVGGEASLETARPGTVAYMSPEQAEGAAVDHRTDLWSLGVVMVEMVTGTRPSSQEALQGAGMPRSLDPVVERLLQENPSQRYHDAESLLSDLRALGEAHATTAGRRRIGAVAATVAAAVLAIAVWLGGGFGAGNSGASINRLAVLPLANQAGDADLEYFVDGVHQGLIAELGKIGSLGVVSRASVLRFRDTDMTLADIGSELGVDAVVEGSVFRSGDSVSISVQLTATSPEQLLWTDGYHRSVTEVFGVTGEVAKAIAGQIDVELSPEESQRIGSEVEVDPRAYDAYLRGWVHWGRRNRDGFNLAASYFQRAIDVDPTFAAAYAGLAETHNGAADWGLAEPEHSFSEARRLATAALEREASLPEGYAALAAVALNYDWDWQEAERLAGRAIELNPSDVRALRLLGMALSAMGRQDEARVSFQRANELDMQVPGMGMAMASYGRRQFEDAIRHAETGRGFDEGLWQAPWLVCLSRAGLGQFDQAIEECEATVERFGRDNPVLLGSLGYVYALAGRRDSGREIIDELATLREADYAAPALTAMVYGALGDPDRAFAWLDRAYDARDTFLLKLHLPFFDPLRADPRFAELQRRIGLAPPPPPQEQEPGDGSD